MPTRVFGTAGTARTTGTADAKPEHDLAFIGVVAQACFARMRLLW